jgi:hypothetical protein
MSIAQRFMDIARNKLSPEQFEEIYADAVANERKAVINAPAVSPDQRITEKPHLAAVVNAHLNDLTPPPRLTVPHVAERLEERLDVVVGPNELGVLAQMIQNSDKAVHVVKRRQDTIVECDVAFMGKQFYCIYNMSRRALITAYPKTKKKKKVFKGKTRKVSLRQEVENQLADAV